MLDALKVCSAVSIDLIRTTWRKKEEALLELGEQVPAPLIYLGEIATTSFPFPSSFSITKQVDAPQNPPTVS